jgi:hypothetical protein
VRKALRAFRIPLLIFVAVVAVWIVVLLKR